MKRVNGGTWLQLRSTHPSHSRLGGSVRASGATVIKGSIPTQRQILEASTTGSASPCSNFGQTSAFLASLPLHRSLPPAFWDPLTPSTVGAAPSAPAEHRRNLTAQSGWAQDRVSRQPTCLCVQNIVFNTNSTFYSENQCEQDNKGK